MIDYQSIIEELNDEKVIQLLEKLDIPFIDKGDYLLMPTVCHHDDINDASWKLYYYKNSHIFHCFTECGSQSIFSFLKNYYETRGVDYDWYNDIFCVIQDCSNYRFTNSAASQYKSIRAAYETRKLRKELPEYPKGVLDVFVHYYPIEWLNDGITQQVMDKFNILFSPSQNKIIIPHYDVNNRLVGIRGRALNQWEVENIGKYMPVQIENQWYSHPLSLNLYGLNWTKQAIRECGIAYLFEGEKSVMQAESFSRPNCGVAVCGSKLNKFALDILLRECHPKEIVICFDQEELPRETHYFNKLYALCTKYKQYTNFSFVYDREHLLKLKDSPTDHGEDTFNQLLYKRIKV